MPVESTILKPVKPEDFRPTFGALQAVGDTADFEEVFAPAIKQFKKFAAGPYFWFVADAVTGITIAAGGQLNKLVPFDMDAFVNHSPEILFKNTHPDDIVQMFAFTNYWVAYLNNLSPERRALVRSTIYLRLLNPNNSYYWAMVQFADQITNADGRVLYGLTLVTDISHIKTEGAPMMTILDNYDDSCQHFLCSDGQTVLQQNIALPKITRREVDVLRLLTTGYSSKQIAADLNVSVYTIHNHRKNLLFKTSCKSSGELAKFAIQTGYI